MSDTNSWFDIPILPCATDKSALDYHQILIELAGAANSEPLVEVSQYEIASRSAYAFESTPYYHEFVNSYKIPLVRRGVAEKLAKVNKLLQPYRVQLLVWDGFRSVALQQELWDYFVVIASRLMPSASEQEIVNYVGRYWSDPRDYDPDDYRTWPTHNTGGAVDLTLQSLDSGQDLFMGSVFDDSDPISSTRYFEDQQLQSLTAKEARRNRRLLYHAMAAGGFFNYHHEWWHYDCGTQMAIMNGAGDSAARYGRATPTP